MTVCYDNATENVHRPVSFYFAAGRVGSTVMSMSVCLSVCLEHTPRVRQYQLTSGTPVVHEEKQCIRLTAGFYDKID